MGMSRRIRRGLVGTAACLVLAGFAAPLTAHAATAGAWGIVPSQDGSSTDNRLYAAACSDAGTCWAVGTAYNGTVYQTLIEQATPSGWVVVPSPDNTQTSTTNGNETNVLNIISCLPWGPCFAAG